MYEDYFGLSEKPFSIQPDPSFLYWARGHRLAFAMLEYGVLNHAGISVVTGEVGCGKTTLVHRLLDQLSNTHTIALLSNVQQGRGDLLSWVLMAFGQTFAGKTHVELFSQLQAFFIGEYAKGRRIVLIIDEAQNLSIDMLEELRLLSNINAGKDQLLQLILVGQPQLKDMLNRPDMLQLAQRVGADFHLTPLSAEEVDAYIDTRLAIAGAQRRIFTERAVDLIAEQSGGVPRVINIIADTALVYAFSAQDRVVDVETIRNVIRDKAQYGVFGLPRADMPAPPASAAGPAAFLKREAAERRPAASAPERRTAPTLLIETADDSPRMPPAARRRARAAAEPAVQSDYAASDSEDEPEAVGAFAAHEAGAFEASPEAVCTRAEIARAPVLRDAAAYGEAIVGEAGEGAAAAPHPEDEFADERRGAPSAPPGLVGVVVIGGEASPEETIASAAGAAAIVYVARSPDDPAAEAARAAGAEVVAIADRALSPGRARNAGYRRLKKARPDLAYVQFLEAGFVLDPDWLAAAAAFMDRRPEVAAIEGPAGERFAESSPYNLAAERAAEAQSGEIRATGATAFIRAESFEDAGGFRGDLPVNETRDLCIRLRRRGAHVWRLDAHMGLRDSKLTNFGAWWARAARTGYEYAHGAALHGARPERLYAREQWRAFLWGVFLPLIIAGAAAAAWFAAERFAPLMDQWIVAGGILGAGLLLYLVKIVLIAIRRGAGRGSSWVYAFLATLGHVPEFFGAWRYHFGGSQPRQADRSVA